MKRKKQRRQVGEDEIMRYIAKLLRESLDVLKTFLSPERIVLLERRIVRLESKVR